MVWVLPLSLMLALSLRHLHSIQNFAVDGSRSSSLASQNELLKKRLGQESCRLSTVFSKIRDETYFLGTMSQTILCLPQANPIRNGSRYHLVQHGATWDLTNDNDGNSVLYAPGYLPNILQSSQVLEEAGRIYFNVLLTHYQGNISKAADHAGINRRHIHRLLNVWGIDPSLFRGGHCNSEP